MTPVDNGAFLPAAPNCGSLRLLLPLLGALALIACSHSAMVDSTFASESESDPKVVQSRQTAAPSQTALSLRKLLHDGQYDKLDALAERFRANRERLPGGEWKLHRFYQLLQIPESSEDEEWKSYIEQLKSWVRTRPKSITARVALGGAFSTYAWKARGHSYAPKVKSEQWSIFQERIRAASMTMGEAKMLSTRCPEAYLVMQHVALAQAWERADYDRLFKEAVAYEPTYFYFYNAKVIYLLPRWMGQEGDWEKFTHASAQRLGGREGSALYSFVVCSNECWIERDSLFDRIPWTKIRQGFLDREALYGADNYVMNQFAIYASLAKDRTTSRALLARIGDRWNKELWVDKSYFDNFKSWSEATDSAPNQKAEYHRIALPEITGKAVPYTVEIPGNWQILHAQGSNGYWLGPTDVKNSEDPRVIFIGISSLPLADISATMARIKASGENNLAWRLSSLQMRQAGNVKALLIQKEIGTPANRRNLILKLPWQQTSIDFSASAPIQRFDELKPIWERVFFSVRPAE